MADNTKSITPVNLREFCKWLREFKGVDFDNPIMPLCEEYCGLLDTENPHLLGELTEVQ